MHEMCVGSWGRTNKYQLWISVAGSWYAGTLG